MEYSIRKFREGDAIQIVKLLELVFNGWPHFDLSCTPLEHWKWKYKDNSSTIGIISIAIYGNRIIGCLHFSPIKIKIGRDIYHCCNSYDIAVHENFRKMGIAKKLYLKNHEQCIQKDVHLTIFNSGNPILSKFQARQHSEIPFQSLEYVRIIDINKHLTINKSDKNFLKKWGFIFLTLINKIKNYFTYIDFNSIDFSIKKINNFDEKINDFWDHIKGDYDFIIERKKLYMNWRYSSSHNKEYVIYVAEHNNKILGYIILTINKFNEKYPVGYIVDILAVSEQLNVVDRLIKHSIKYFNDNDVNVIKCILINKQQNIKIFNKNEFIYSRYKEHIFYKKYKEIDECDNMKLINMSQKRYHFCYGDRDLI